MLSSKFPSIINHLRQLGYGLQPVQVPPDGHFILIIKMHKEAILTARLNQQIKLYLVPDTSKQGKSLGLITAFFDDHNEPITLTAPLFSGDAMLHDLAILLGQEAFDLYFFDEHDRELTGVRVQNADAARLREAMGNTRFPVLDLDRVPAIWDALSGWFVLRDAGDDERAFVIELGERLYPDAFVTIDSREKASSFHGADARAAVTSLEREAPGPFQERDIAALLHRAFPAEAIFLNPIREDSRTEFADVLVVTGKSCCSSKRRTVPIPKHRFGDPSTASGR